MEYKYHLKITDWLYEDSSKNKYTESEFTNFIDSSYMSVQQFLNEVETMLQDSFESERKIQEWQNLKGMLIVPKVMNMDDILITAQKAIKEKIINKSSSAIVECKLNENELEFIITTNLTEKELVNLLQNELNNMTYKLILPFTRAYHTTLSELIRDYMSKTKGNFSLYDEVNVEGLEIKYDILNISDSYGYGVYLMTANKFDLKTIE